MRKVRKKLYLIAIFQFELREIECDHTLMKPSIQNKREFFLLKFKKEREKRKEKKKKQKNSKLKHVDRHLKKLFDFKLQILSFVSN